MDRLLRDLRYAARSLSRAPAFSIVSITSLTIGVAACMVAWAAIYHLHLRPLPYKDADRLVRILESVSTACGSSCPDLLSSATADAVRHDGPRTLERVSVYVQGTALLALGEDERAPVSVAHVEPALFEILGPKVVRGRVFQNEDARADGPPVALVSDRLWRRQYGGDPSLVGGHIDLDELSATVIGVLPEEFQYPEGTDVWVPLQQGVPEQLHGGFTGLAVRGVETTVADVQTSLDVLASGRQLEALSGRGRGLVAIPEESLLRAGSGVEIVLGIAVGITFLIACANLGNLFMLRVLDRRPALLVRQALGATNGRIARHLATESAAIVAVGTAAGILLAKWTLNAGSAALSAVLGAPVSAGLDLLVVAPVVALAGIAGAVTGLVPMAALSSTSLPTGASAVRKPYGAFVFAQVAATVVLVAAGALLFRSYLETRWVDLGLDDRQVLTAVLAPDQLGSDSASVLSATERIVERLGALPGARSAAAWTAVGLSRADLREPPMTLEDRGEIVPDYGVWPRPWPAIALNVTPEFFASVGVRPVHGRLFDDGDVAGTTPVTIVNRAAAQRLWPGEDPIGRRFKLGPATSPDTWLTVVGVVENSAMPIESGLGMSLVHGSQTDVSLMYRPLAQAGVLAGNVFVALRPEGSPSTHVAAMVAAVREVAPGIDVPRPVSLRDLMSDDQMIARVRLTAGLLVSFAASSLLLALLGIYGVVAESVRRRTRELGIRMALGAPLGNVVSTVVMDAMKVTLAGLAVGIGGALVLSEATKTTLYGQQFARSGMRTGLLFGVDASEPRLLVGACLLVLTVAALAGWIPVRRATQIDPAETLRQE